MSQNKRNGKLGKFERKRRRVERMMNPQRIPDQKWSWLEYRWVKSWE